MNASKRTATFDHVHWTNWIHSNRTYSNDVVIIGLPNHDGDTAMNVLLAVAAAYLLIVQWIYLCGKSGSHFGQTSSGEIIETILLSLNFVLAITFAVCRIYVNVVILPNFLLSYWAFLKNLHFVLSSFQMTSVALTYGVLWLRQRAVHSQSALSHLSNRISRFVSKYFVFYIIIVSVGTAITSILLLRDGFLGMDETNLIALMLIIVPFTIQIPLLSLMIFPLYKHHTTNMVMNAKYVTLMKRIVILTIICVISDVTCSVVAFYVVGQYFPLFIFTCLLANMFINATCVILTPTKWKEKIFPCIACLRHKSADGREPGQPLPTPGRAETAETGV